MDLFDSVDITQSDGEPDNDELQEFEDMDDLVRDEEAEENESEKKKDKAAEQPTKKKRVATLRPQPKLDTDRLKTTRGLIALKEAQKGLVLKGKGHESRDLDHIMFTLEHWANRLFPKLAFDDFIEKTENLGRKKIISTFVKKMRMGDTLDIRGENGDVIQDEVIVQSDDDEFIDDAFGADDGLLFARNDNNDEEQPQNREETGGGDPVSEDDDDYEKNRNKIFDSLFDKNDDKDSEDGHVSDDEPKRISRTRIELASDDDDDDGAGNQTPSTIHDSDQEENAKALDNDDVNDGSSSPIRPISKKRNLVEDEDSEDERVPVTTTEDQEEPRDLSSSPIRAVNRKKRTILDDDQDDEVLAAAVEDQDESKDLRSSPVRPILKKRRIVVEEEDEELVKEPLYDGPPIEWNDFGL